MRNEDKKTCTCEVCGKVFPYVHGYGTATCSKECLGKLRSKLLSKDTRVKVVCKNCGKEFYRESYETTEFCNRSCYWEYRRNHASDEYAHVQEKRSSDAHETRKCEMCGKEFYVYKKTKKRFCSDECRVKYQNTEEFKNKRLNTMLSKYGTKSMGNGWTDDVKERYDTARIEKYEKLCEKSNLEILEYMTNHILRVKCKKCGGEFITNNLSYLPYDIIHCKNCSDVYKDCATVLKVYSILDEIGVEYIKNDRTIINPYEIDVFIPSHNIGIEVNGNFWHSELCGKDRNYHINKTELANKSNVKLIHIFEDEIETKYDIVKSRILNLLGKCERRIYARKCTIREIDSKTKKNFLNSTHIQGDTNSSINLGMFHNDELVSVMTFGKERIFYKGDSTNNEAYELIRFSNSLKTAVIGAFSKFISYFNTKYHPSEIKTFCDVRWSSIDYTNTVYSKNGFEYIGKTQPNYWYMHKAKMLERKHRYNFTKHSILSKNPTLDGTKTEWELMKELGYNRIFDCGNLKFVKHCH